MLPVIRFHSMSGQYNGAQKKLLEKLQKNVVNVPCQGHRSNTVVEHSCNSSVIIQEMFNMLKSLYMFCTVKFVFILKFHCALPFHI